MQSRRTGRGGRTGVSWRAAVSVWGTQMGGGCACPCSGAVGAGRVVGERTGVGPDFRHPMIGAEAPSL